MKKFVSVLAYFNMMLCGAMLTCGILTLIEAVREGNAWYYLSGIGDFVVAGLMVWESRVLRGMDEQDHK